MGHWHEPCARNGTLRADRQRALHLQEGPRFWDALRPGRRHGRSQGGRPFACSCLSRVQSRHQVSETIWDLTTATLACSQCHGCLTAGKVPVTHACSPGCEVASWQRGLSVDAAGQAARCRCGCDVQQGAAKLVCSLRVLSHGHCEAAVEPSERAQREIAHSYWGAAT